MINYHHSDTVDYSVNDFCLMVVLILWVSSLRGVTVGTLTLGYVSSWGVVFGGVQFLGDQFEILFPQELWSEWNQFAV
jgi:hypothetical protein